MVEVSEGTGQRAVEAARAAVAADPQSERNHRLLAVAYQRAGDEKAAAAAAREAVRLAPHTAEPHLLLARVLLRRGQWRAGYRALDEALRLDPTNVSALHLFAEARIHVNDPARAELVYRQLLSLDPLDTDAIEGLGHALRDLGRSNAARSAFVAAGATDPRADSAREALLSSYGWWTLPACLLGLLVTVMLALGTRSPTGALVVIVIAGAVAGLAWLARRYYLRAALRGHDPDVAAYVLDGLRRRNTIAGLRERAATFWSR